MYTTRLFDSRTLCARTYARHISQAKETRKERRMKGHGKSLHFSATTLCLHTRKNIEQTLAAGSPPCSTPTENYKAQNLLEHTTHVRTESHQPRSLHKILRRRTRDTTRRRQASLPLAHGARISKLENRLLKCVWHRPAALRALHLSLSLYRRVGERRSCYKPNHQNLTSETGEPSTPTSFFAALTAPMTSNCYTKQNLARRGLPGNGLSVSGGA